MRKDFERRCGGWSDNPGSGIGKGVEHFMEDVVDGEIFSMAWFVAVWFKNKSEIVIRVKKSSDFWMQRIIVYPAGNLRTGIITDDNKLGSWLGLFEAEFMEEVTDC